MSVTISVPDELYRKAVAIANLQHASVDEIFARAFAEQMSAWDRLQRRAAAGTREKFLSALDAVPDVEAADYDRL